MFRMSGTIEPSPLVGQGWYYSAKRRFAAKHEVGGNPGASVASQ